MNEDTLAVEHIEQLIHVVRGCRVILDEDIAALYEVETAQLVRAVQRNSRRFPGDFMFQLTGTEFDELWQRLGRTGHRGGRRTAPYAFTEHGVAMLSGVLRSEKAIDVNVQIIRAFVQMRSSLATHERIERRLTELETKYDTQFSVVFQTIRQLMQPPDLPKKHPIGFGPPPED